MLDLVLNAALGYLMVLGIFGYVVSLQIVRRMLSSNRIIKAIIISIHYVFTMCAIIAFPVFYIKDNLVESGLLASFAFAIVVLGGLGLIFYAVSWINLNTTWK
jgi:hypothetical protein